MEGHSYSKEEEVKLYIETIETEVPETEIPQFIRIDVTDLPPEDRDFELEKVKEIITAWPHYQLYYHHCYHEERGSCSKSMIEEK